MQWVGPTDHPGNEYLDRRALLGGGAGPAPPHRLVNYFDAAKALIWPLCSGLLPPCVTGQGDRGYLPCKYRYE